MPKSKSIRKDRTKRAPRDPGPEREDQRHLVSVSGDQGASDGTVIDELDELDTEKYEPPPHLSR